MNEDGGKVHIESIEKSCFRYACLMLNEHFLLRRVKVYIYLSVKSDPLPESLPSINHDWPFAQNLLSQSILHRGAELSRPAGAAGSVPTT